MTTADTLLAGLAPAASAWLLTYVAHSTLLLGGVWLATRSRRVPAALQDVLWKVALWGGLLSATLQLASGRRPAAHLDLAAPPAVTAAAANTAAPSVDPAETPARVAPRVATPFRADAPAAESPRASFVGAAIRAVAGEWEMALLAIWALGAVIGLVRYRSAWARLRAALGARREVADGALGEMATELCRAAGVRRQVRVTCSEGVATPVALGRAEICVPPGALALAPAHQRSMLAHELAHLLRGDPRWLAATGLLEGLFFFQPLNRLGRRRMQEAAEYACDDWASRVTGSGVELARCLVAVARWAAPAPRPLPLAGIAEPESPLVRRVRRLLDGAPRPSAFSAAPARVAVAGALVALAGLFAPGVAASRAAEPAPRAPQADRIASTGNPGDMPVAASPAGPCWRPDDPAGVRQNLLLDGGEYQVVWTRGDCTVQYNGRGDVRFTPDERDLVSLAGGGFFVVDERDGGHSRKLEIRSRGGRLERTWTVDGARQAWNDEAGAWLAAAIPDVLRFTGMDAGPRSQAVLRRAGAAGLLREIALIHGDDSRIAYLRTLLGSGQVADAMWPAVLREVRAISADGDRARLLTELVNGPLRNRPALAAEALAAARGISSDEDHAQVLAAIAGRYSLGTAEQEAWLREAATVSSDVTRTDLLRMLVRGERVSPATLRRVLEAARGIGSDYSLSGLLVEIAGRYTLDRDTRALYLDVAQGIRSPSLQERAVGALRAPAGA